MAQEKREKPFESEKEQNLNQPQHEKRQEGVEKQGESERQEEQRHQT